MANNYLYATRETPFQSFLQGFGAGQNIVGNINQQQILSLKNQMLQEEFNKQQAVRNALADYGQPGFDNQKAIKAVMQADPKMGIEIANLQRGLNKDQVATMAAGYDLIGKAAPGMLNDPRVYMQTHEMLKGMGMGNMMAPITNFVDPQSGQLDVPAYTSHVRNLVDGKGIIQAQVQAQLNPKYHYLPTQDAEGNAILNRIDERTGKSDTVPVQGYKQGMTQEVTLPDGTVMRMSTGGKQTPGGTGVTPKTQGDIEDRLNKALMIKKNLESIKDAYNPSYQTYGGKLSAGWTALKSAAGIGKLSPDEVNYASQFFAHKSKSYEMLNSLIKEISGATVTDQEAGRLKAQLPTAGAGITGGDSPIEYEAKMKSMFDSINSSIIRLNYLRKSGFSIKNNKELEEAINKSGIKLDDVNAAVKMGRDLRAKGVPDAEIKQKLADKFGWVM